MTQYRYWRQIDHYYTTSSNYVKNPIENFDLGPNVKVKSNIVKFNLMICSNLHDQKGIPTVLRTAGKLQMNNPELGIGAKVKIKANIFSNKYTVPRLPDPGCYATCGDVRQMLNPQ